MLGIGAMFALPMSYQWVLRPASVPAGLESLVPVLQMVGIVAAGAALLLGRRARAAGDRTDGAVWAPRLGAAAMVGYVMMLVLTVF